MQQDRYFYRIGKVRGQRALLLAAGMGLALVCAPARAEDSVPPEKPAKPACLSSHEVRGLVERGEVISVHKALQIARSRLGGDVVKARLCSEQAQLIYLLTLLDKNSQISVLAMDAHTGQLLVRP